MRIVRRLTNDTRLNVAMNKFEKKKGINMSTGNIVLANKIKALLESFQKNHREREKVSISSEIQSNEVY